MARILGQIYKKEKYQSINGDDIYILYSVNEDNIFCAVSLYKEKESIICRCTDGEVVKYKVKLFLEERGLKK